MSVGTAARPGVTPAFSVMLPTQWFVFDLVGAGRTGELARLIDRRIDHAPSLAAHRATVLRAVREVGDRARRAGAVFTAAMAEPLSAELVLLASAVGVITALPDDGRLDGVGLDDLEAFAATLQDRAASTEPQPDAVRPGTDELQTWRRVERAELAIGPCVRVTALESVELAAGQPIPVLSVHTLAPVPGRPAVLDLVLSTPQVALAGQMVDLFCAIASTLTWTQNPNPRNGSERNP